MMVFKRNILVSCLGCNIFAFLFVALVNVFFFLTHQTILHTYCSGIYLNHSINFTASATEVLHSTVSADMLSSIIRRDVGSGQMGHELSFHFAKFS